MDKQAVVDHVTLYLGFSGVLHTQWAPEAERFKWAPVLEEILEEVDPTARIKIVLTSDAAWWGGPDRLGKATACLPEAMQKRVVGTLDHSLAVFDQMTPGRMIVTHVQANGVQHWIAVEADDSLWPEGQRESLIKTDCIAGLGDPGVRGALKARLQELLQVLLSAKNKKA